MPPGNLDLETLLLVGLDPPETTELRRRLDRPVLAFETLPASAWTGGTCSSSTPVP